MLTDTRAMYLEAVRRRRGFSQRELAKLSGVPQPTINRLENKPDQNPGLRIIDALAKALRIRPDLLRFGPTPAKAKARMAKAALKTIDASHNLAVPS